MNFDFRESAAPHARNLPKFQRHRLLSILMESASSGLSASSVARP
jgi:hypothetical protein